MPLRLRWLLKSLKHTYHQILIKEFFFKVGGRTIRCEIQKLINYIWKKKELPEEWKKSIILRIYKKGDKTDCGNYKGISLLSNVYKHLFNTLSSRLTPNAEEITGDHQCGFRRIRSTTYQIFCIRQVLEENWE